MLWRPFCIQQAIGLKTFRDYRMNIESLFRIVGHFKFDIDQQTFSRFILY